MMRKIHDEKNLFHSKLNILLESTEKEFIVNNKINKKFSLSNTSYTIKRL